MAVDVPMCRIKGSCFVVDSQAIGMVLPYAKLVEEALDKRDVFSQGELLLQGKAELPIGPTICTPVALGLLPEL